jgi:hypothetical protein
LARTARICSIAPLRVGHHRLVGVNQSEFGQPQDRGERGTADRDDAVVGRGAARLPEEAIHLPGDILADRVGDVLVPGGHVRTRPAHQGHHRPDGDIVASQDHAIPPAAERFMAARMHAHTVQINSSHAAMVSHPGPVTDLILSAAEAVQ